VLDSRNFSQLNFKDVVTLQLIFVVVYKKINKKIKKNKKKKSYTRIYVQQI